MNKKYEKFIEDAEYAHKVEEPFIIPYVCRHFNGELVEQNKTSEYDYKLKTPQGILTFEQKTDYRCVPGRYIGNFWAKSSDTGHLVAEYECFDRPSAISVTKSDYWVNWYAELGQVWIIPTPYLRWLISNNNFHAESMGKNLSAKGLLIPRELIENKIVIDNVFLVS
jgi:hypothetical protein